MNATFNLIDDPWIKVRDLEGKVFEVGLRDLLTRSHELAGIDGELPTQAAAIQRLAVAIAYRALSHAMSRDDALDEWEGWWESGRLPVDRIVGYLEQHHARFDLLHPEWPFMQVASLHTASGKTSGLPKLIAEVPDGYQFFTRRSGPDVQSLSFAEAARWLVHIHAYDPSGIKSGAVGDPEVKGGKGYPIGQGWAGWLGLVVVEGRTLAETLLLNLMHTSPSPVGDEPVWERAPQGAASDASSGGAGEPRGVADLLTWQVRRVRLIVDEGRVTDCIVSNGDRIRPANRQLMEPSTAYRYSEPQTKALGQVAYMPLEHQPQSAMWRGLPSLLAESKGATQSGDKPATRLQPPIIEWLSALRVADIVARTHPIRMRGIGMVYGPQASSITEVIDDTLSVHLGVLTDPVLRVGVTRAAECTHEAIRGVGRLAENLSRAAGGDGDGPRARATERAYALIDPMFSRWLASLSDPSVIENSLDRWHVAARACLEGLSLEIVQGAGGASIRGRLVGGSNDQKGRVMDAGLASIYFRRDLHKALDRAIPRVSEAPTNNTEESP